MEERTYDFGKRLRRGNVRTKKEIIESLKRFACECGSDSFTQRQYDSWPHRALCASQVAARFGGWPEAMMQAGLKSKWKRTDDHCRKEMVNLFKECWVHNDDQPTERTLANFLKFKSSKYTTNMYKRNFGGVTHLAERVRSHHLGQISDEQLFERSVSAGAQRQAISRKLRFSTMERDGFRCVLCGVSAESEGITLEVDHIDPVAHGGSNDPSNLQTLCIDCNRGKRDRFVAKAD